MAEPVYTFDRQSMRRISAAVQKSEGVKDRKGNKWYPVKGGSGGSTIQIGKTKPFSEEPAPWENDESADLYVYQYNKGIDPPYSQQLDGEDNPVVAEGIYNLFGPVLPDSWVQWQGSVRIDSQQDILIGKTDAVWEVGDSARIIPLDTGENPLSDPGFLVLNLFAKVEANKWVAFMPNAYADAILISAEC
ncbi:MAG: hypothetical protein ACR2NF_09920 [Pirellulales bacterium]